MAIGAIFPILGASALGEGVGAGLRPSSDSPPFKTGDIFKAAMLIQGLSERGLVPVASTDPFTGNLVISTENQADVLFGILSDRAARLEFPFTEEDEGALFAARERFIDRAAATARPTSALTQTSPPAFSNRVTARPAPAGGVSRGGVPSRSAAVTLGPGNGVMRLSSPCAGPQTGISRLRCGGA